MATNVQELRWLDQRTQTQEPGAGVRIRTLDDIPGAAIALERAVRTHALRIMIWHDLASLEPMVDAEDRPLNTAAFGWSEQELAPWQNRDKALRSPLLRAARLAGEPCRIDKSGIHAASRNNILGQIECSDLDEPSLYAAAIIVPVQLPFGQIGAAILVSNDPLKPHLAAEFARSVNTLAPAITRFVTDYVTVTREERYLPSDAALTTREIECLSWVAHGKTDYEISIILGCSHAGVRYHITRACAKLGAVNRSQSVFRACQLGYLGVRSTKKHGARPN